MRTSSLIVLFGIGFSAGCVFITEDEYAQRLHQAGAGSADAPCVEASWWLDGDGDGFGDPDQLTESCEPPSGTVDNGDDCDDTDAERNPDTVWYADADGDGFGGESTQVTGCDAPPGSVSNGDDCNDANSEVHPDALEDCATPVDDNCTASDEQDGSNDPSALGCEDYFADADGDGFAGPESLCLCQATEEYPSLVSEDCDDGDAAVNPAAEETCGNGVDDDCDGTPGDCGLETTLALTEADFLIEGAVTEARYGTTIAGGGDLTGDGIPDAVIAGYHYSGSSGQISLVPGPLTEDLTTASLRSWEGPEPGEKLGMSMAIVEDTDGDGVADLLIGSPQADGGGGWSGGAAYLISGPVDPEGTATLPDAATAIIEGGASGKYLGRHVSGAGDFDGDGLGDVVISIPGDHGAVLVLGPIIDTLSAQVDVDSRMLGPAGTDCGIDTAGVGDVDGDGLGDILVAARTGGPSGEGKLYLVLGHGSPASALSLVDSADVVLTGAAAGDATGEKLGAGDANGDGRSDLFIAAPGADLGGVNAGVVYVVVDPALGSVDLATEAWLTVIGSRAYGRLGTGLDHLLNADGGTGSYLVAGAPEAEAGASTTLGEVFILDASVAGTLDTAAALGHFTGTTGYGQAGAAVQGVGDMDGDGIPDLMIGEPVRDTTVTYGGAVYLMSGGGL